MLILMAGMARIEGDGAFAERHRAVLKKWADYLLETGFDPPNQLCTDDFAGHLAHNANLSLKAIIGVAAYAQVLERLGGGEDARAYRKRAKEMVARWLEKAAEGDHFRLAFDQAGTWSQKYNLAWDRVLDLKLFPPELARKEIAFYKTKLKRFGLPLDNRETYTKLDWCLWTASLAEKREDFDSLVAPLHEWEPDADARAADGLVFD